MIKRRSLLKLILLSIITCGIYAVIFWYQYSDDMNRICEGDGRHTQNFIVVVLLSFLTLGIYYYVWLYGVANRLADNAPQYGANFNENGLTVLLWTTIGSMLCGLGPFIAMYILIKNMNVLAERYNEMYYGNYTYDQDIYKGQNSPFDNL